MKKFIVSIVIISLAVIAFVFSNGYQVREVEIHTGNATYHVIADVADTVGKQTKGLMGRQRIPEDRGMLFVYKKSVKLSFWMKNMRIPIDMFFIDNHFTIRHIVEKAKPCPKNGDCPSYRSPIPVRYVLELQSGFAQRFGVKTGDKVLFK